jgi:uncharacterized membrane protein
MSVVDRLGAALCEIVPRYLPTGAFLRDERLVLAMPNVDYQGLLDAMFHMIRQNASGSAAVLIRMLDVLTAVVGVERDPARMRQLGRHADLIAGDAECNISTPSDLADIRARHAAFATMREHGPLGQFRPGG